MASKVKATVRQKRTLQNIAKSKTMKEAMLKAGYSESYSKNNHELKAKLSWQELLDKYLPEKDVSRKLRELSEAVAPDKLFLSAKLTEGEVDKTMKSMDIPKSKYKAVHSKAGWEVVYGKPDFTNRNSALDKIMKARGSYAPDKVAFTNTAGKSLNEVEIEQEIEELEKQLRVNFLKEAKNGSKEDVAKGDKGQAPKPKSRKTKNA